LFHKMTVADKILDKMHTLKKQGMIDRSGFTTIEVIISLFIITILISISLGIVLLSNQINARTRAYSEANSLAFSKIQEYELKDFGDIDNGSSANNFEVEDFSSEVLANDEVKYSSASAKVRSQPVSGSLKKIVVLVVYSHLNETREIEYATYIQMGGVGR